MGTKVQNLPGYYSMRDLNEESSSCGGWPLFYVDKIQKNGNYYNNHLSIPTTDACSVYDKDVVKRMILEHEAIFKNQVYELHRLYRIQRDMMNECKRKELQRNQIHVEASFSTGPLISQITTDVSGFPMGNSGYAKTSASVAAGAHSPLDSIKGMSKQVGLFPSPDGCSLQDGWVLESRSTKVRRKMFDLQLPADENDDTEESEKLSDENVSGSTLFLPHRSCKNGKEEDVNLFCGNGGKTYSKDISRSEQSLRRRNGLADLNEPIQVEETYDSPDDHLPSNKSCAATECFDLTASAKQKSLFFGLTRENLLNSHHVTDSLARSNGYLENNGSGKGGIPLVAETGQAKRNLQHVPLFLKPEKSLLSSQTMQDAFSKAHEPTFDYINGRSKADMWREKTVSDLHVSERNHGYSVNGHPGLIGVASSSDISKSWSHSAASWGMASCTLSQKLMSAQTPQFLNSSSAINRNSQSHQSNELLDNSWPLNMNSKPNPDFQCHVPLHNGFYPGSSSCRSKEPSINISSTSYDYLNHNDDCKIIPKHFINNGSTKYSKGSSSNCNDMKAGRGFDLNVMLPNGSYNNSIVPQLGVRIWDGEQKHGEHHAVLPWLRGKTSCMNEVQNSDRRITAGESSLLHTASLSIRGETEKEHSKKFMHRVASVSCSNNIEPRRTEARESSSNKKILGVPIFDMAHISPKKELSSITSPSLSIHNPSVAEAVENNRKNRMLDINLPCDDEVIEVDKEVFTEKVVSKRQSPTREADSRNHIDLNLSMSEDEGSFTTIISSNIKMKAEIDLETPAVPETEGDLIPEEKQFETSQASPHFPQDTVEQQHEELMRNAAQAIVVLSSLPCDQVDGVINSPFESPMVDPLSWFVDVVSSHKDNPESKFDVSRGKHAEDNENCSYEKMDYFESMTLKLEETKEEDYMPKSLVPENFVVEEMTSNLPTRTRRGAARRGRQRKDFQRDILPGLTSLSRHEVTEDLQTFGGLMRATGYSWQSGLTRRSSSRNGGGRGRRRAQVTPSSLATNETSTPLLQHLNYVEVGLEDRSLTGWGKTTRRPRRQRCPAGNPPLIPIT